MSFSEDSTTPAAPFSGDGSVFDQPDVLLASPMTSERVVDTQSGFLLVIRRMGERLAFSCKRRVGTPPTSAILLTPDESLKLSKILSTSIAGMDPHPETDNHSSRVLSGRRKFPFTQPSTPRRGGFAAYVRKFVGAVVVVAVFVCVFAVGMLLGKQNRAASSDEAFMAQPLSQASVASFARTFVSRMLDFNPDTYKLSQIHAMASMSPELMEKYWQETNFPLSLKQLKALPQDTMLTIERVTQQSPESGVALADVYAQLVHPSHKTSTPVHLRLKLVLGADQHLRVVEQEDLTASDTPGK